MAIKDIAYERRRTRDLLLEYDIAIVPFHPRAAGLNMIYPWENISNSIFRKQLYDFAHDSGYLNTESDFNSKFGSYLQEKEILFDTFDNFPEQGDTNTLYFDLDNKKIYYWDNEYLLINNLFI